MCEYCNKSDAEILSDIIKNTVPIRGYSVWLEKSMSSERKE